MNCIWFMLGLCEAFDCLPSMAKHQCGFDDCNHHYNCNCNQLDSALT